MEKKRKEVQEMLLSVLSRMEPGNVNRDRYADMFEKMDDAAFDTFMKKLRDGNVRLEFYIPNMMKIVVQQDDLLAAADMVDCPIFERLKLYDEASGTTYMPDHAFMVLRLPVRRTRQYLYHKRSVPESDKRVDALTGQVVKPDQASKISLIEGQLLYGRGLNAVNREFYKVRGGDLSAYANMRQQLEQTGECSLESVGQDSVPRSVSTLSNVLKCMHLDNNYVDTGQPIPGIDDGGK